jgi:DNA invertase Pin-like site-specific DNA recombinase
MHPVTEHKRLIAYLRVSTDEQADSGAGLAAQEEQLRRAFEYEGWELVELVRDEGASGKDLHRDGLRRALETSTPTGAMVAHVLVVVAEWERRTIGQRTKDAMAAKRRAGEVTGLPSLWDEAHAALRERILELHAGGSTRAAIARQLNQECWPTLRGASEWRPSALQVVLGWQRPPRRRRRAELPPIPRRRRATA